MLNNKLNIPGTHQELISGPAGVLEVILEVPPNSDPAYFAVLGHPHSLQGGTMQNKVVTTLARAFRDLGIPSIRFNFRGVGGSSGEYDAGLGESEDMLYILHALGVEEKKIFFAGFSFGSYVAYRALVHYKMQQAAALITIAPSVHHYDYGLSPLPENTPWLIVIGVEDELVPVEKVTEFAQQYVPPPIIEYFPDTGHFFHGKLIELKTVLQNHIRHWIQQ